MKIASLALLVVLLVVLVGLFAPIDRTPYFSRAYYQTAMTRIDAAAAAGAPANGPLQAGFGRASLTPDISAGTEDWQAGRFPGLTLAGYGRRHGAAATSVATPMWAKSVALRVADRTVVFTSMDLLLVPSGVTQRVAAELPALGLSRAQLYLSATHTHSGPGDWEPSLLRFFVSGPYRAGVERWIARQVVASIRAAMDDLQPAAWADGHADLPQLVVNRLIGDRGRKDAHLPYLAIRQDTGRIGVIAAFAAHPTILGPDNLAINSEYPGAWQRALEEKGGVAMALFMAGPVGSHGPARIPGGVEAFGEALARPLLEDLPHLRYVPTATLGVASVELPLPRPQIRIAEEWRVRPVAAEAVVAFPRSALIQVARVGSTVWASTPSDFSGEMALDFQDSLALKGLDGTVTSFNGSYVGYLLPAKYADLDEYESRDMSFYGPQTGTYFFECIVRLAAPLITGAPAEG